MHLAVLIFAGLYSLPDGVELPAPDKAAEARVAKALQQIRRGGGEAADRAVRDLALVGEGALPAIVARLNEAPAGERLLLLAAVRRMPKAVALLGQARRDQSPAVRAWAAPRPARAEPDLRYLASRYLDLLALAEEKRRIAADKDLAGLKESIAKGIETYERVRLRMRDRRLADAIQAERGEAAARFARAGAGRLRPSLTDPVFVAYLALLREEGIAHFYAVPVLVALGGQIEPVLEPLLAREHHDPRTILRILFAVRADGGRGLYGQFDGMRPDTQRALVTLAPELLAGGELTGFLERAAVAPEGSVRAAALDALLERPAPAGREAARKLLDPTRYSGNEFRRAARLLARCGELDRLASFAEVEIPDDGSERAAQLRQLQRASATVLRLDGGDAAVPLGERFCKAASIRLRSLGMDLIRDPQRLLELSKQEAEAQFADKLALRALDLGGRAVAGEVVAFLKRHGKRLPTALHQALGRGGCVEQLVELAGEERERRRALGQLAQLESIDKGYEAALLGLHETSPDKATLEALLPLGTPAVREQFRKADPEQALKALAARAEANTQVAASIPLVVLLKGADASRLRLVNQCAAGQVEVEPGLFCALFLAWDAIEAPADVDAGPAQGKLDVLRALARSSDTQSAQALLDALLQGKVKEPPFVLGILKAAARLLPPAKLMALVPVLREQIKGEYPQADKQPPPWDAHRAALLRGGIHALGYARVEGALDVFCDLLLDPRLQPAAFEFKDFSSAPFVVLNAMRHFPPVKVNAALRKALARAEADGRLAALHPRHLFTLAKRCRQWRSMGRGLYEVMLALCEVLERLPWEGDFYYEKMRALGGLRRYQGAADAARAFAKQQAARSYGREDGLWTAAFMEGRALMYEALAARDVRKFQAAMPKLRQDPFLLNLAAWYLLFYTKDLSLAGQAAQEAVRGAASLYHPYRDTLAGVRLEQGRSDEALRLLDEQRHLPVKRTPGSGWHLYFQAKAHSLRGEERAARQDLERALNVDRRLLQTALGDPAFKDFADLFRLVEDDFLDALFAWQ